MTRDTNFTSGVVYGACRRRLESSPLIAVDTLSRGCSCWHVVVTCRSVVETLLYVATVWLPKYTTALHVVVYSSTLDRRKN